MKKGNKTYKFNISDKPNLLLYFGIVIAFEIWTFAQFIILFLGAQSKCSEATTGDPPLFYLATSIPTKYVQCDNFGNAYIRPCAPGTEWCQHVLTCVHVGSCTT